MKHLIACDLDGSLLNKQGQLTKKSIHVLNELRKDGHIVVIATGRPYEGAIPKYLEVGLDTPLITDNGGSIINPMDSSFARQKTYLPLPVVHELFKNTKEYIISAFFSDNQVVYAYKYDKKLEEFFNGMSSEKVIELDFTDLKVEPTGLVYLINSKYMKTLEAYVDQAFGDTLSHRLWGVENGYALYEIYLKHISKSSALTYLLDHFGMKKEQLIAFGDGINDVEMIRDAHLGVAMSNGVDEVKAVCKDVTKFSHDEDGIANYLIEYFNLKDVE
ncbi:MAG: Cof-type HAD-IIB family hydrolase [Firmicutes bacterium]|nr:Cof-type HAD-IIB family hydrolase [Bacillota bacterium]